MLGFSGRAFMRFYAWSVGSQVSAPPSTQLASASALAVASVVAAVVAGLAVMWARLHVAEPNYLEGSYFFLLVPLVSPQGWDYVLLIALPAYVCLVDRWRELSPNWRAVSWRVRRCE